MNHITEISDISMVILVIHRELSMFVVVENLKCHPIKLLWNQVSRDDIVRDLQVHAIEKALGALLQAYFDKVVSNIIPLLHFNWRYFVSQLH